MKYLIAITYSIAYQLVHILFLFRYFEYLGYKSFPYDLWDVAVTAIFILLPLRLLGKGNGFVELSFSTIYFLLYIPILITFLNHYKTFDERIGNQIFFFIGFYILFLIPRHYSFRKKYIKWYGFNTKIVLVITMLLVLLLIGYFRSTFSVVSFDDVYSHRAEVKGETGFLSYFVLWNTYFFGPLTFIIGLLKKKKLYILTGIAATISAYGIASSKISLFIPLIIYVTYYLVKTNKSIFKYYGVGLIGLIAIFLSVPKKLFILSAVVLMRTIGIGGLLTYQYNEFFKKNPLTYLSHVNVINAITHAYPYNDALGFVVSKQYVSAEVNANANFWATDGIAGFGLYGVIFISIVFGFLLVVIKSIESKNALNYRLLTLMFVPFNVILLNVSLFTSIISGGLVFLLVYAFSKGKVG